MSWDVGHDGAQDHAPTRRDCAQSALTVLYVGTASAGGGKVVRLCVQGQALMCKDAKSKELDEMSLGTVKKSPPTFVQAGPMDPWALMQKALLDALVHQK